VNSSALQLQWAPTLHFSFEPPGNVPASTSATDLEAEMRKQDRIAREQERNSSHEGSESRVQPQRPDREQMRGSEASDQPSNTQRQPGKPLPLPE
jgi:hypothetical protein